MNPDTRRLLQVRFGDLDFARTGDKFNMLMGKGEAAARRDWIEEHGNEVEADI
jgi:topoisomerase-4 subunit B